MNLYLFIMKIICYFIQQILIQQVFCAIVAFGHWDHSGQLDKRSLPSGMCVVYVWRKDK